MSIGERLRKLRHEKAMSQADVERATGIMACYTSRVEHGHTVPSLGTLEKYAAALRVPLYRLFYEGDEPAPLPISPREDLGELAKKPGEEGSEARSLIKLKRLLHKVEPRDRGVFLAVVQQLAANCDKREANQLGPGFSGPMAGPSSREARARLN